MLDELFSEDLVKKGKKSLFSPNRCTPRYFDVISRKADESTGHQDINLFSGIFHNKKAELLNADGEEGLNQSLLRA